MTTVSKHDVKLPSQQTQPVYRRVPRSYHDGKSPAAWVGAMGTLVGFVIGTVGFLMGSLPVIIVAGIVIAVSLIGTLILRGFGYGEAVGYDGRPRS